MNSSSGRISFPWHKNNPTGDHNSADDNANNNRKHSDSPRNLNVHKSGGRSEDDNAEDCAPSLNQISGETIGSWNTNAVANIIPSHTASTKKRKSNTTNDVPMMCNDEELMERDNKRLQLSEHGDQTSSDGGTDSDSNNDENDDHGQEEEDDAYHVDLIKEINEMTFEERERALYDLHGVASENGDIPETPDLLEKALHAVERLLGEEYGKPHNEILRLAMKQYPERITDPNFRLMFLRADDFDPDRAVDRLLRHLTEQQLLFGGTKVGKRITQDDLSVEDMRALENSHFQLFPEKDSAGRLVIFDSVQHRSLAEFSRDSLLRMGFYTMMSGVEGDELVQRRGVVIVLSYLGNNRSSFGNRESNQHSLQRATQLFKALPLKERAVHGCMNPNRVVGAFDQLIRMGIKRARTRWRIHQASLTECKYALLSFGIPVQNFPIEDDLSLNRDRHLQWLQYRRELEMHESMRSLHQLDENRASVFGSSITGMIANPTRRDILFGRGKRFQEHAGNMMLNSMVESMLGQYNVLDRRNAKTMLSRTVVDKVREKGGRFLRPSSTDPKMWEEADDDTARTKVSHVFRSLRWRQKNDSQHAPKDAHTRVRTHGHADESLAYLESPSNDRDAWTYPTPFRWTNL